MSQLSYTSLIDGDQPLAAGFNSRFLLAINLINAGIESDNLASSAVTAAKIGSGAVTGPKIGIGSDAQGDVLYRNATEYTRLGAGTSGQFLKTQGAAANPVWGDATYTPTAANALSGSVIQVVNTQTGAVATGTTLIPFDDTIPQNTEGDQYMTLAITPGNTNNKLKITVVFNSANSSSTQQTLALFQDTTAGALAAVNRRGDTVDKGYEMVLVHYMTAGTTSSTTFKVRAGDSTSGTMTFNGVSAGRIYGGVMASSITITEIKV